MSEEILKRKGVYWKQHDTELIKETLTKAAERVCAVCALDYHPKNFACGKCKRRKAIFAPLDEKEGTNADNQR